MLLSSPLARRAFAEFLGTALLLVAVIGSGVMARRLSPHDVGLQLLENSVATAAALIAIILAVGPVSGAHLNPVVTLTDRVFGALTNTEAAVYVGAQFVGGAAGAVTANLMFTLPAVELSTTTRSSPALWLGEVVATFGLLLVVFGVTRTGRGDVAPFAVGAYLGAAYWFTSSTSFANPAATLARTLTNTFAGIAPASAPAFIAAQLLGAALAVGSVQALYPHIDTADEVIVPHTTTPTVLFLCTHNAGRSQMALGFFTHLAGDRAVAWSGGSEPGDAVNKAAIAAMAEVGIDISGEYPKPWTDDIVRAADVVITMGCGDACPLFPSRRYEEWVLDDPHGLDLAAVRPIRDDIENRVRHLLGELHVTPLH